MKDKIVIIGASGHGKVVADIAKLNGYQEIVFVDDDINKEKCGLYKVVGTSNDVSKYKERYDFFVAIGSNDIREKLTDKLNDLNIEPILLIHPSAVIDATVSISSGTVIMANAVLNADVKIGKGCIINTGSTVDHRYFNKKSILDYKEINNSDFETGDILYKIRAFDFPGYEPAYYKFNGKKIYMRMSYKEDE